MIYFEGAESIIESLYLDDKLNDKISDCDVFVNPENIKYLIGKTVIINISDYPEENIKILQNNNCKIIYRVFSDNSGVEVRPYILKLNFNIMWNGKYVEKFADLEDLYEDDLCEFDIESSKLYFPKLDLSTVDPKLVKDEYGNLSALGWLLQQVGVNVKTDTPFTNMDIIKTGKIIIE